MAGLTDLCEAAFEEPFAPIWERVGPGIHVIAELGGRPVAHAMVVDRTLHIGTDAIGHARHRLRRERGDRSRLGTARGSAAR